MCNTCLRQKLVNDLIGKTVTGVFLEDDSLTLTFEDRTKLVAARCSGPANGEYEVWTLVTIDGHDIINK